MMQLLNTIPHVCGDPNIVLFLLPLNYCHFATVMNCNVNIRVFQWSWATPVKGPLDSQRRHDPQVESHCFIIVLFLVTLTSVGG